MKIQRLKRFQNLSNNPLAEPLTKEEIAIMAKLAHDRAESRNSDPSVPPQQPKPAPPAETVEALVALLRQMVSPLPDVKDKPETTMTVASWNLRYLSKWKSTYLTPAIEEVFAKVDLVALQEPTKSALDILEEKTQWKVLSVRGSDRFQRCAIIFRPEKFKIVGRTWAIEAVTRIPGLEFMQPGLRPFLVQTLKHAGSGEYVTFIDKHPKSNVAGDGVSEQLAFLMNGKIRYHQFRDTMDFVNDLARKGLASRQQIILADTNCPLRTALEIEPLINNGFHLQNPNFSGVTHRLGDWFDGCFIKNISPKRIGRNFVPKLWDKKEDIKFVEDENGRRQAVFTSEQELFLLLTDHVPWVQEINFA